MTDPLAARLSEDADPSDEHACYLMACEDLIRGNWKPNNGIYLDLLATAQALLAERAILIAERDEGRALLEPFAALADRFKLRTVVEVCYPHPDNPSPNIAPLDTKHFRAARAYLTRTKDHD